MSKRIENIIDDIKEQYLEKDNNIPWIIGFSGGKDSTVVQFKIKYVLPLGGNRKD